MLVLWSFCLVLPFVLGELSPKESDMAKMLATHEKVYQSVLNYIFAENKRITKIRHLLEKYMYFNSKLDDEDFLSNPVYSYVLPKRITNDFDRILDLVFSANESQAIFNEVLKNDSFPSEEYVENSAQSLLWLLEIHNNTENRLVKQQFKNIEAATREITARDCFDIGLNAYQIENPKLVLYWMDRALSKMSGDEVDLNKTLVLEHISAASFEVDDYIGSLLALDEILKLTPGHPRALKNLRMVLERIDQIKEVNGTDKLRNDTQDPKPQEIEIEYYKALCSELKHKTPAEESGLFCRFRRNQNPRLLLQPAKEEDVHLNPKIRLYHDVLSRNEIKALKELVMPKLATAKVVKVENERLSRFRTSLNAWLNETTNQIVDRIDRRIGDITGLSMETAEYQQIANYGVGGYYRPHLDAFGSTYIQENNETEIGDRLATWMVYMNEVEAGGSTVFPFLTVSVKPKKGSALFWYNLFENSSLNVQTLHGSCPVVAGTKWVLNKWIRERGQEFMKPCSLTELQ